MENKVYVALVVFATMGIDGYVLVNSDGNIFRYLLENKQSLQIVNEKFRELTGIYSWHVYFRPSGFFDQSEEVDLIYTVYLPGIHTKVINSKWVKLSEIDPSSRSGLIIRVASIGKI